MAKSKAITPPALKHTKRQPRKASPHKVEASNYPDAKLIRLCILIASNYAAVRGCGNADPDGNNIHAEPIWTSLFKRANAAIEAAGNIEATTWAGIVAKAAAMTPILDDELGMEPRSENFFRSFAADTLRLAKAQIDHDRMAARGDAAIAAMKALP